MRGPPSGRAQEGRRQPPNKINGSYDKISASCGRFLGIVFETQGPPNSFVWQIYLGRLLYKRTGLAAGPLKPACCLPTSGRIIRSAPEWIAPLVSGLPADQSPWPSAGGLESIAGRYPTSPLDLVHWTEEQTLSSFPRLCPSVWGKCLLAGPSGFAPRAPSWGLRHPAPVHHIPHRVPALRSRCPATASWGLC